MARNLGNQVGVLYHLDVPSNADNKGISWSSSDAAVLAVQSVSLDKTNLELTEGDSAALTATVKPDNASNKRVLLKRAS